MKEKALNMFKDSIICIFGGSGTIGSILVEYLRDFNPKIIRIFCNDENSLWEKQLEWGNKGFRYLLGDIRNYNRVKRALKDVDYVFNAAAIKHVPFCEYNPLEAVEVNIIGLDNIINASIEQGIKKLLHISTDKAVEPSTVMGCSKKISESLLQMRWAQNPTIQMVLIRFGNVYGSRGSIVPLIKKCKKKNEPITITNLDMERFFIYIDEVIELIMKAFIEGKDGEIWIPKLKERKLMDIIEEIVGTDYPISIIGRRKGEKLKEKLLSNYERSISNQNQKYWIVPNEYINYWTFIK